ncbi:hypothetical protein F511_00418 [Dorcoceras hygrometricum]|nr:hypothetical protein F511_00418 [Dorcoceras hygrometricum]
MDSVNDLICYGWYVVDNGKVGYSIPAIRPMRISRSITFSQLTHDVHHMEALCTIGDHMLQTMASQSGKIQTPLIRFVRPEHFAVQMLFGFGPAVGRCAWCSHRMSLSVIISGWKISDVVMTENH